MSRRYTINCTLWADYTAENISHILKKGENMGFSYEIDTDSQVVPASAAHACEFIISTELPYLWVRFENTSFSMGIMRVGSSITITFLQFGEGWKKKYLYDTTEDYDIQLYGKLLLDLICDFKILEFLVELS